MPELPEVETTVRALRKEVINRSFIDVWSDWPKIVKKPKGFENFKIQIKNKKVENIWRRAKNVIFDLSGGYLLLVHQKMTGHLLVGEWKMINNKWVPAKKGPLQDPYNRFLHIIFFLDGGKMLALSDARKFAKIELQKKDDLLNSEEFKKLGPEPLEDSFTSGKFKKILKNLPTGRQAKRALMDQNVIAGIGNIYASEILWQAKIHPQKSVGNLKDPEILLLYISIKKVLRLSVKLGGESFSDYRKPDGSKGNFDTERKIYKKEGQKCRRCGSKIKRIKLGGRSSFFCPFCQKL